MIKEKTTVTQTQTWKGRILKAIAALDDGTPSITVLDPAADARLFYNSQRTVSAGSLALIPALWHCAEQKDAGTLTPQDETLAAAAASDPAALDQLISRIGADSVTQAARRAGMAQTQIAVPPSEDAGAQNTTCAEDLAAALNNAAQHNGLTPAAADWFLAALPKNGAAIHLSASSQSTETHAWLITAEGKTIAAAAAVLLIQVPQKAQNFIAQIAQILSE